ncbi:MAG: ribulose-phosphate 3-epimerase [Anaerolineae bacterium]
MQPQAFEIVPSILSADFARLGEQVREVCDAGVTRIQVDVMDGMFVPNITMGPLVIDAIRPICQEYGAVIEAHLMIVQPERYLKEFAQAGSDVIMVHVETCAHLHRTVQQIRELGKSPAVVLNPATPLVTLEEILPFVDEVLLMTVNPGFGGQEFITSQLPKVTRLRNMLRERGLERVAIEVDGGISVRTIKAAVEAGATLLIAGSAVYNKKAPVAENIRALQAAVYDSAP